MMDKSTDINLDVTSLRINMINSPVLGSSVGIVLPYRGRTQEDHEEGARILRDLPAMETPVATAVETNRRYSPINGERVKICSVMLDLLPFWDDRRKRPVQVVSEPTPETVWGNRVGAYCHPPTTGTFPAMGCDYREDDEYDFLWSFEWEHAVRTGEESPHRGACAA